MRIPSSARRRDAVRDHAVDAHRAEDEPADGEERQEEAQAHRLGHLRRHHVVQRTDAGHRHSRVDFRDRRPHRRGQRRRLKAAPSSRPTARASCGGRRGPARATSSNLFTPGDLLRMDQLQPDDESVERQSQPPSLISVFKEDL